MERYGVFKWFPNGARLWVCPADDLIEAKSKMLDLARTTGHEHFIQDLMLRRTVATSSEDKMGAAERTEGTSTPPVSPRR